MPRLQIPKFSEEDALARILSYLRSGKRGGFSTPDYGNDIYIPNVVSECFNEVKADWQRQNPDVRAVGFELDDRTNSEPFYDAAWNLCTRGVLRPGITIPGRQFEHAGIIGGGFNLTSYGRQWLSEVSGYECIPSEFGRFSQLLASHAQRFGDGYQVRSQEALRCYRAHTYLACCVMCGAASESILLALAVAKTSDEERILKDYRTNRGRSKIENLILSNQNSHIQQELPNYTSLLTYWRNDAAHGANTSISEGTAFTSLVLLLRFAQFSDDRWDELTT